MKKKLYKKMADECIKKGMTKKQINKIENAYDAERKNLKRENARMEKHGITVALFSAFDEKPGMMDKMFLEIGKQSDDPVDGIIRKEIHDTLMDGLMSLEKEDRVFILELFLMWNGNVKGYAESLDVPRETVRDRRNRILRRLKKYFEKNGFSDATI